MAEFDPYATLGVTRDAPDFVVKAAYRACIKKYHPDHYAGADARQRTADIFEAYRLIGNAEARSEFDRLRERSDGLDSNNEHKPEGQHNGRATPPINTATQTPRILPISKGAAWFLGVSALIAVVLFLGGQERDSSPDPVKARDNEPAVSIETAIREVPQPVAKVLPELDDVFVCTNPVSCEMSAGTEKLFENLIQFDPPTYVGKRGPEVNIIGFDQPLTPKFSRKVGQGSNPNVRDNEATLATTGLWHGLKVSKIRVRYMEQSSFWEHQIRFFEPATRVRERLNELGFQLPPTGEFREFTGDGVVSAGIGVEEVPGGAALYCGSSVYY